MNSRKAIMKHQPAQLCCLRAFAVTALTMIGLVFHFHFAAASAVALRDDPDDVREVLKESVAAFERGDMAVLNRVWASDDSITVFEQGHANYGWADYRDNHLVPEIKEMKNTKYGLSDIRVKVASMTAWATFKYSISADVAGRHVEGGGLGTAVLEKREGRWQIVHWHTSAPRRPPSAPIPAKKH